VNRTRNNGKVEYWKNEILEKWNIGKMEYWKNEILEKWKVAIV
jgi:hypothetical protein